MPQAVAERPATISVIIPAFNQAHYLAEAIWSAIAQTRPACEIIVIDDGSTDATPDIAKGFHKHVRYIRQPNQGLASARNTGIAATTSRYIALLDSDDVWQPEHLAVLARAVAEWPNADAWISGIAFLDRTLRVLPQQTRSATARATTIDYWQLLRANSIIPSAALIRRDSLQRLGCFDEELIGGCEDWDFWLRLAITGEIISLPTTTVGYRLHETNMSAKAASMCTAAKRVMARAVGPEDNELASWSPEKRRGWGGANRYCAIAAMIRNADWLGCATFLRHALKIDATLAQDEGLFYELALGTQPLGYRGSDQFVAANAQQMDMLLQLLTQPTSALDHTTTLKVIDSAWLALARLAYNIGNYALTRSALLRLFVNNPSRISSLAALRLVLGSTVAVPFVKRRHKMKQSAAHRSK